MLQAFLMVKKVKWGDNKPCISTLFAGFACLTPTWFVNVINVNIYLVIGTPDGLVVVQKVQLNLNNCVPGQGDTIQLKVLSHLSGYQEYRSMDPHGFLDAHGHVGQLRHVTSEDNYSTKVDPFPSQMTRTGQS